MINTRLLYTETPHTIFLARPKRGAENSTQKGPVGPRVPSKLTKCIVLGTKSNNYYVQLGSGSPGLRGDQKRVGPRRPAFAHPERAARRGERCLTPGATETRSLATCERRHDRCAAEAPQPGPRKPRARETLQKPELQGFRMNPGAPTSTHLAPGFRSPP